jgi:hypothetical protein
MNHCVQVPSIGKADTSTNKGSAIRQTALLMAENQQLKAKVTGLISKLEEFSKESSYYQKRYWDLVNQEEPDVTPVLKISYLRAV